jgi:hypothetical protein
MMVSLPVTLGNFSRTVPAEAVNDGLPAVHGEGVFVSEMRKDILHKRAVHVDELPASAAFEVDMKIAPVGIILIICTFAAAAGEFFQFSLVREGRQRTENGRFAGLHLTDQVTRGKTAVLMLRKKAQNLVALSGFVGRFFCHEGFTRFKNDNQFQFEIIP